TRNKAGGYCVTRQHHDGDSRCRVFGGLGHLVANRKDYICPESHKFSDQFWQPLGLSLVVTRLEDEILPFGVPMFAEAEPEGCRQRTRRAGEDPADSIDLLRLLLRFRSDRRQEKAECENDREPDPPHGHLVEMAGGSLADDGRSQELAALVRHRPLGG